MTTIKTTVVSQLETSSLAQKLQAHIYVLKKPSCPITVRYGGSGACIKFITTLLHRMSLRRDDSAVQSVKV